MSRLLSCTCMLVVVLPHVCPFAGVHGACSDRLQVHVTMCMGRALTDCLLCRCMSLCCLFSTIYLACRWILLKQATDRIERL